MHDVSDKAKDLSLYRWQRANEDYSSSQSNLQAGDLRTATNRAYYAIFHALRAILALDEFDTKKHSGIISEFRHRYVKTGIFSSSVSDIIGDAFEVRNKSDYEDMFIVSRDMAEKQVRDAGTVINAVSDYLKSENVIK